jgi:hypothetical protein
MQCKFVDLLGHLICLIYISVIVYHHIYTSRCSKKNKRLMYPNKADAVVISLSYSWRLPPPACRSRWRLLIIAACLYINAPRRRTSWQQQLLVYMCINYTCVYTHTHTHTHTHTYIYIYIHMLHLISMPGPDWTVVCACRACRASGDLRCEVLIAPTCAERQF